MSALIVPTDTAPITSLDDARVPPKLREMILANTARHWWWDRTLNPFRGCTPIGPGCEGCWAIKDIDNRQAHRIDGPYIDGSVPTFHPVVLDALSRDRVPKRYFCPSVSDPHHEAFTDEMRFAYYDALFAARHHFIFSLTSRAEGLSRLGPYLAWEPHVIAVVSVGCAVEVDRLGHLHRSGALRMGCSFEPLIGAIDFRSSYVRDLVRPLDHAIFGGHSEERGKVKRMRPEWLRAGIEVCLEEGVPVMFKQWGDLDEHGVYVGRKRAGRELDGVTYDALPAGCLDHLVRAWAARRAS